MNNLPYNKRRFSHSFAVFTRKQHTLPRTPSYCKIISVKKTKSTKKPRTGMGWPQKSFKVVITLFVRPKKSGLHYYTLENSHVPKTGTIFNKKSTSSSHEFSRDLRWFSGVCPGWLSKNEKCIKFIIGGIQQTMVIWGAPTIFGKLYQMVTANEAFCLIKHT